MATKLHELIGGEGETEEPCIRCRRADNRAATRLRILEVATSHFVRFGYRKASIADIAQDCGLGKGTVYLYFDSKQTLISACVALEKRVLVDGLARVLATPLEDRLEAYIRLSLRFVFEAPLSSAIVRGDRELKMLMAALPAGQQRESEERAIALMSGFVPPELGLDEARIRELTAVVLAVLPLTAHLVDPERRMGLDVDAFIDGYARILARGLLSEKPA